METQTELFTALSIAKKSFVKINNSAQGYGYNYANLEEIHNAVGKALRENGLVITHGIDNNILITSLIHTATGQRETSKVALPDSPQLDTKKIQALGACITYYRRYNINLLLDLSTADSDGDLEKVQQPQKKTIKKDNALPENELHKRSVLLKDVIDHCKSKCQGMDQSTKKKWITTNMRVEKFSDINNFSLDDLRDLVISLEAL